MDRQMIEDHLRQAEEHVALREQMVARQRALVAELARDGRDTHTAMMLLAQLEESLELRRPDRDRLRTELGKPKD
jgi:cytidylate kinase